MLEDSGPVGAMFDHGGKTYRIKPNFLCGELLRMVKARKLQLVLSQAKLMMANASPVDRAMITRESLSVDLSTLDLIAAMSDIDMIPVLLSFGCSITMEEANSIVSNYHDIFELSQILINSLGLDTLKNFAPLRTKEPEDATQVKS